MKDVEGMMAQVAGDAGERGDSARRLILILGGARSGKSAYAEALAARMAGGRPVAYVATAAAVDEEMRARIAAHRAGRPPHWQTIEAPLDPAGARLASEATRGGGVILLDCVTLLVSNLLLDGTHGQYDEARFDRKAGEVRVAAALDALLAAYQSGSASLVLVSNEVGMGLVPPYPLGRVYRDALGRANIRLAREADAVVLMVAGLPVELKAQAAAWERRAGGLLGIESE